MSEQPLVNEVVEPTPLSVDPTLPSESDLNTTQFFYTTRSEFSEHGGIPLASSVPPPSHGIISFDWNGFTQPCLPFSNPFQIIVRLEPFIVYHSIVDEGASVTILSSDVWKALGYPELVSVTNQLVAFDRRHSEPLGVLPQLPISLGGKTVCIDVMVVQGPLDFNLLLGRDYVYVMEAIVSTLFRVMHFPHDGNIVTIDQLSFDNPYAHENPNHSTPLSVPSVRVDSTPPQVNYVASYPMFSIAYDKEPLFSCSSRMLSNGGIPLASIVPLQAMGSFPLIVIVLHNRVFLFLIPFRLL